MSLQLVCFRTDGGAAAAVRSHHAALGAALRTAEPQRLDCTAPFSGPGPDFILAVKSEDSVENPPAGLLQAAQPRDMTSRALGAPVPPEPFTVVGAYHS